MPRAHRRYRHALGATLLAGALALSACDGGSNPTVATAPTLASTTAPTTSTSSAPPTTATAGSSTSAALAKPEMPAVAAKRTPEGAEAFVRHYIAALNFAWQAPEGSVLPPLYVPECSTCKGHQENAESLGKNGQRYRDAPFTLSRLRHVSSSGSEERVGALVRQRATAIIDGTGKDIEKIPKDSFSLAFMLKWEGKWVIFDIG